MIYSTFDAKHIETLLQGCATDEERAEKLTRADKTVSEYWAYQKSLNSEKDRSNAEMKRLNAEYAKKQADCPHWLTKYYPDASGNNDSWTECEMCGMENPKPK